MSTPFRWPVRVYNEDTDTGGVVYYANYLKFFERARTEWLRSLDIGQQRMTAQENVMFVVKNATIDYHAPAKLDDALEISVTIEKIGRASVNFSQGAWRTGGSEPELLCSGQIRVGCVDARSLRPASLPVAVLEKIKGL
ncbi:MAG: tol-pal system-associated acyl-CoA thioesterase [Oxalobacteraceae bacterium]